MAVKFSNNFSTSLVNNISSSATVVELQTVSGLPTLGAGDHTYLTFDTGSNSPTIEIVKVTAINAGTNEVTIERAQDNTTASAFAVGTIVEQRVNAAVINDLSYGADETSYDNTESGLVASNVQSAIDELQDKKLNVADLAANLVFYPTSASSDISTYFKLVTSTDDTDYDDPAVDISTGVISGSDQFIAALASEAGILAGSTGVISINTVGNVRRVSGFGQADFYFEVYKRDSGGTETLMGTSNSTREVGENTYEQFFAECLITPTTFAETDRIVFKYYGNRTGALGSSEFEFQFGGSAPVRSNLPVPVNVVSHANDAEDILVDTGGFSGVLSGSDDDVQAALATLDGHVHDGRYYTESEIGTFFAGTTAITGYNKSNWDTAYGWGNHASAGYLTGNQTITLTGDVSGSGTTSIAVTIADDSHTHDGRYYTESEADSRFISQLGGKVYTVNNGSGNSVEMYFRAENDASPVWRHIYGGSGTGFGAGVGGYGIYYEGNPDYSAVYRSNGDVDFRQGNLQMLGTTVITNGRGLANITSLNGGTPWHSANDGSGSGLDADLLDGVQAASFLRSDADDTFTGNLTTGANNHITFGPNSTWGSSLRVGGNGRTATGTEMASVVTTDGNLHLDAADSTNAIYLNFYAGTKGTAFGTGASGISAWMSPSGQLYKSTGIDNTSNPYWHAANDGSGSGLDADLLDGYQLDGATSVATRIFNNKGQTHPTYTDFNTVMTPGPNYLQAGYNGPGAVSQQFYGMMFGLGSEYGTSTGTPGHYASQMYYPRAAQGGSPYLYFRDLENGSWGSWQKVYAGYADSAGNAGTLDGIDSSQFLRSDTSDTLSGTLGFSRNDVQRLIESYNTSAGSPVQFFIDHSYGNVNIGNARGNVNIQGSVAWHAGNDGSGSGLDADLLDGQQGSYYQPASTAITTANIGSQSVSSASTIDGISFRNGNSSNGIGPDYVQENGTGYITSVSLFGQTDGALYSQAYSTAWVHQIFGDYRTGNLAVRGRLNGTWQSWKTVWTSANDGSGSGLDADLLDGQQGSYYQPASTAITTSNIGSQSVNASNYLNSVNYATDYSSNLIYWQASALGTDYAPDGSWYNTIRGSHGGGVSYYSNTLAIKMTGPGVGDIYTQTRVNGTLQGWNRFWHSNNDGSGSGLDADLLDGNHSSFFADKTNQQTFNAPLNINGGTAQGANDGTLYVTATNNNDWGLIVNKYNQSSYEYGIDLRVGASATYAFRILGNAAEKFRVNGEGQAYYQGNVYWHAGNDGSGSGLDADLLDGQQPSSLSVNYANYAGYANYLPTRYAGGQQTNPQVYFGQGQGLRVAMTAVAGYWSDTLWINGYAGGDVLSMCALHTSRQGTPRMWITTQASNATSYGGLYEFWTSYNDGSGSGLDADLLDGVQGSSFARLDTTNTYNTNTVSYFRVERGGYSGSLDSGNLQVYTTGGNSAFMSFHRSGAYAVNMGLDADNVLRIGGWSASANRWVLDMSGNMTAAGNVTAYSDIRLKENIEVIPDALEKVQKIRGVTFTRNDQEDKEKLHTGVIAQEVEAVLPEVISEDNLGIKNVAYGNMVGLLIEAIKELKAEVDDLKAQLKEK
jgi:hypothetical protein